MLDARWWNIDGTGSFTRALARGLRDVRPGGEWTIWGPGTAGVAAWHGSTHQRTEVDPARWLGQRQAFRVPGADLVIHPHQIRPAHSSPAASCVLDLIQLRQGSRPVRQLRRSWLRATARSAEVLFTIAPSVRDEMAAELGLDPARICVLHLPVDGASTARVRAQRAVLDAAPRPGRRPLVAIGRAAPHKNHRRLVEAFAASRFAATGGQLHLIGLEADGLPVEPAGLHPGVHVLGRVPAAELDLELAGALALVQPSLAEGYGLPAAEALAAGVPVVSSPIPAVSELGPAGVPVFDPRSVRSMTEVIDETVQLVEEGHYWERVDHDGWLARQPTEADLARQVLAGIEPAVGALDRSTRVLGTVR